MKIEVNSMTEFFKVINMYELIDFFPNEFNLNSGQIKFECYERYDESFDVCPDILIIPSAIVFSDPIAKGFMSKESIEKFIKQINYNKLEDIRNKSKYNLPEKNTETLQKEIDFVRHKIRLIQQILEAKE